MTMPITIPDLIRALERLSNASEDMSCNDPDMPSYPHTEAEFEAALSNARIIIAAAKEAIK